MKIFLRDITELPLTSGVRVRFSVTFAKADGTPLHTVNGYTMDSKRRVQPPAAKGSRGHYFNFITDADELTRNLRDELEKMKSVQDILGPSLAGIAYASLREVEGEAEIEF